MPEFRRSACPLCGSTGHSPLGRPDLSQDPVGAPPDTHVVECRSCGHLRIDPMPWWSPEDFVRLYGEGYFVPDSPRWAEIRARRNPQARLERIRKVLASGERRLLEVGSGIYAHFCTLLHAEGWTVRAQEPSTDFGKALQAKGIPVEPRPFEELPEDETYSVIYADSVFEHVPDPVAYFRKASRLLLPGGILYLVLPRERSLVGNIKHLASRLRGGPCPFLSAYRPPYHLQGFTRRSLEHAARASGLKIARIHFGEDWFWLHALEKLPPVVGHLAAAVLWAADRLGLGGNLEVALVKEP